MKKLLGTAFLTAVVRASDPRGRPPVPPYSGAGPGATEAAGELHRSSRAPASRPSPLPPRQVKRVKVSGVSARSSREGRALFLILRRIGARAERTFFARSSAIMCQASKAPAAGSKRFGPVNSRSRARKE